VFDAGGLLADIFQSRAVTGRDNAAVSQGGTAWEGLICWYMNLVFWGTDVVVVRPHSKFVPTVVSDALSVTIQNVSTNTESDLIAFSIPSGLSSGSSDLKTINQLLTTNLSSVSACVIQCKTNWNDNSQIPMLWDLIYNSTNFRVSNVSIGKNGVSPASFKRFAYSFVTVPTSRGSFETNSLPVLRVRGLSGGNYWGHPTKPGVARAVSDFFTSNFAVSFSGGVQQHIQSNLTRDPNLINKFTSLSF
jgi:hypothetical protein